MRLFTPLLALGLFFISGCTSHYRDTALYTREGRSKPIVAVMPVISQPSKVEVDTSVAWDIAEELTEQIRGRVFEHSKLYLLKESGDLALAKELNAKDPMTLARYRLEEGGAAEFVVVTELVDQKIVPCSPAHLKDNLSRYGELAATLEMNFRVRVLDVRGKHPHVILQEIVHHDHYIPRPYLNCDYAKAPFGSEAYERTPMGMAHGHLAREVVARIESYIHAFQ